MRGNFSEASQADNFDAGIGQRFFENSETAQKWVGANDFIGGLQSQGKSGQAAAQSMKSMITKAVGTADISAVRLVSLSTDTSKDFNIDTVLYNMLAGRRLNNVTDFTHAWVEEDFGAASLDAMVFNPNEVPVEDNTGKARRSNTLTAIGKQVNVGLVSAEMIKKRGFLDEMDRQINAALQKIRRSANRQLLIATEDATGPVYKVGGLFTRSTANAVNAGSAALTTTMLDTAILNIVNALGMRGVEILGLPAQAAVIHALMKSEYPGRTPESFGLTVKPGENLSAVYYSPLVGAVPFRVDLQVPTGKLMVWCPEEITMNGFTIGDMAGPWVIALAQTGMSEPKVVFDMLSLEDRLLTSRSVISNIA